jgi:hypothetical protein
MARSGQQNVIANFSEGVAFRLRATGQRRYTRLSHDLDPLVMS